MKSWILSALALSIVASLEAQQPQNADKPPLPPGPLINRLPAMASWQINYTYAKENPSENSSTDKPAPDAPADENAVYPWRTIIFTRTGDVWMASCTDIKGRASVVWSLKGARLTKLGGSILVPSAGFLAEQHIINPPGMLPNLSANDFPGTEWISPDLYTGVQKFGDRIFWIFRDEKDDRTAQIDASTRFPVRVQIAGVTQTYRINPPPTAQLSIPADFRTAFQQ